MPESNHLSDELIGSLPAGNNVIGQVKVTDGTDVADVIDQGTYAGIGAVILDGSGNPVTSFGGVASPPDVDITTHTNYARKYYTASAPTDGIVWSPASGKRWHITSFFVGVASACTVTLEDDKSGGDDPVWKMEFTANSGWSQSFDPLYPMASGEDTADLTVTCTAGNVYVTVIGYEV